MTGWELVATAERVIGSFWSLTRSQVYRELATMAESGLVEAGDTGPRDRRPYRVTTAGRDAFQAWLRTEPGPEQIRYPLLLTVRLGRLLPEDVLAGFLAAHRERHRGRLDAYEEARPHVVEADDPFALATLDFGIRYERAVLEWFESLPDGLRTARPGDEPEPS